MPSEFFCIEVPWPVPQKKKKYHDLQSKSFKEETQKFSKGLVYKIYKFHGEKGLGGSWREKHDYD